MRIINPTSPLRYPGGKSKIVNFVKAIFRENGLMDAHYAEPYAGGAAVALSLLYSEYVEAIHINDKSRSIYAFWHSVVHNTDAFVRLVETTEVTMAEWHRQKSIQQSKDTCDLLSLGFSTFFLNRTNRSGIISGGMIGGHAQSGTWKLDARFIKQPLIERIRKIGRYRRRIKVYNLDAVEFLTDIFPSLPSKKFLNLDPPYYVKGQCLYDNFYEHQDHESIAKIMVKLNDRWIVTYDNVQEIIEMYPEFQRRTYGLTYTAGTKQKSTEIMIFSRGLKIPRDEQITALRIDPIADWHGKVDTLRTI
jgi:DNA adenine methylase